MDKHTATPWHASGCAINGPATPTGRDAGIAVCERRQGVDPEVASANARFIVRAVNSHDALYEACKAAAAHFEDTDAPLGDQLRAALSLVEREGKYDGKSRNALFSLSPTATD